MGRLDRQDARPPSAQELPRSPPMPQVTMPQLGEGVEQGTIGKWLKAVGDHVRIGDPIVEVVTDKVNAEVPSPFEGTLTKILVAEGDTIANDVAIAEVQEATAPARENAATHEATAPARENAATNAAAPAPQATTSAPQATTSSPQATPSPPPASAPAPAPTPGPAPAASARPAAPVAIPAGIRMTPAVRRLTRERGVDVSAL